MSPDAILADLAELSLRPYDFVMWAFPWGEAGTELENRKGPEPWQKKVLIELQQEMLKGGEAYFSAALKEAYQVAVRSGHDIGKTAFLSWIMWWALSTREDTRGRATANTEKQLRTILWAELAKWHRLFIAKDFFKHEATAIFAADPERQKTWRIDAIPWSKDNPEAFAGLHNYGKRVIVVFDEASAIIDRIWEVVDGVMHEAETELIWICTGNPTRNYGRFYECFHKFTSEWHQYKVDSREVSFANKEKIERAIENWGLSSDFVKVRYLGDFPSASSSQLIEVSFIEAAMSRPAISFVYEPLILGVDVARYGGNESVIQFRRGKDARSLPTQRFRGYSTTQLGDAVAAAIKQHSPDAVFVDEGGIGGGVVDFLRYLGHSCIGVNFGSIASTRPGGVTCVNKRAEMYVSIREWLREGGILEDSLELREQLISIEFFYSRKEQLQLVSKEEMLADGIESPDWADALALTFAYPVSLQRRSFPRGNVRKDYDPLGPNALNWTSDSFNSNTVN